MPEFVLDTGGLVADVPPSFSETPAGASAGWIQQRTRDVTWSDLDEFTRGYVEALFFSSGDEPGVFDGREVGFADLAPETLAVILADCREFAELVTVAAIWEGGWQAIQSKQGEGLVSRQAGRDFWYTRVGHGCGFWDGDWPEPFESVLDRAARQFRSVDPYLGDDGRVYLS